jgi:hypothetical protein
VGSHAHLAHSRGASAGPRSSRPTPGKVLGTLRHLDVQTLERLNV